MEFKLNKIDTDIRKKMQEETKEDKVHSGKSIDIKKDIKYEKKEEVKKNTDEKNERRYITIDGVLYSSDNISIRAEKVEEITNENSKGRILDKKK